jgi:hypothetical protein
MHVRLGGFVWTGADASQNAQAAIVRIVGR